MKHMKKALICTGISLLTACGSDSNNDSVSADSVYQNGYIYTSDKSKSVAEAVAVKNGEIVYVGTTNGAQQFIATDTTIVDLDGKMMLPGLHDVHIHPTSIADFDMCDLGMEERDLDQLVAYLKQCKTTYKYDSSEKIVALQWNSYTGNTPTTNYASLVEALDAVSKTNSIFLLGPDGHTAAVNNRALENAGITKASLASEHSDYAAFISVDATGNPTGKLTEAAMKLAQVPSLLYPLQENPEELPKIPEKLNKYGITSVQDAWVSDLELDLYKTMADNGNMTFRLTAAQAVEIDPYIGSDVMNYDGLVDSLKATRDSLDEYPLIKATSVKIMLDGVQEAGILETPPTLPTSLMLNEYTQPVFDWSTHETDGIIALTKNVDLNSTECIEVQTNPTNYDEISEINTFTSSNGFHPNQCQKEKGLLLAAAGYTSALNENNITPDVFLNTLVSKLDKADLTVHMHAVGDGSTRAAINAIEYAKNQNTSSTLPHTIAHLQVVHPDDQKRLGELGIYLAFTFAWAVPSYEYDLSVLPFIQELPDFSLDSLYNPNSYGMKSFYPAKSAKDAGAILVAGSDAPVDTREPVPFVHIATGITRDDVVGPNEVAITLNANERVSVHDMIEAYTINGAKVLRQDDIVGSIEVGKRADLVIINQNIIELAEDSENEDAVYDIFDTEVLTTIFDGKVVYNVAADE